MNEQPLARSGSQTVEMLWCCDADFPQTSQRDTSTAIDLPIYISFISLYIIYLFIHLFILFIYTGSSWKHDGTRRGRRTMCVHVTSSQTSTCGDQDTKGKRFTFVETGDSTKTGGVTFKKSRPLATSPRASRPSGWTAPVFESQPLRPYVLWAAAAAAAEMLTDRLWYKNRVWYLKREHFILNYNMFMCYYNSGGGCATGAWRGIARLIERDWTFVCPAVVCALITDTRSVERGL